MKVLILTYYWPPSGGSGVQRWLKFVKYLQEFGITPIVYTVENPEYATKDKTLEAEIPEGVEVLRQPIWEPYQLASFFTKKKAVNTSAGFLEQKPSLLGRMATYIRANYFIPDARMFWIQPSVKYLEAYLKENPVDAIISSGPPHSLHIIALKLKQKLGIKWISDFRDPWTSIDYFHQLPLTNKSLKKHFSLEKKVLKNSDAVIVVGKTMQDEYIKQNKNTVVVSNGYDLTVSQENTVLDNKFSITHIGMMNEDRNPFSLWKALKELCQEIEGFQKDLEIQLIGKVAVPVFEEVSKKGLSSQLKTIDYLSHDKVQEFQKKSQVLLLTVNKVPSAKGIVTGKIFEYLVAKRPILALGPEDGDLAEIIKLTNSGTTVAFENTKELKAVILDLYRKYKRGSLEVDSKNIAQYHRKELTKQLATLINETINS